MPQKGKFLFKIMVLFLLQVVVNIHTDLLKKKIPEKKLYLAVNKTPGWNRCLQRLMDQLGLWS